MFGFKHDSCAAGPEFFVDGVGCNVAVRDIDDVESRALAEEADGPDLVLALTALRRGPARAPLQARALVQGASDAGLAVSAEGATALQLVLSGDAGLWTVVLRSLAVSATACALACGVGLVLGAIVAVAIHKVPAMLGKSAH